MFIVTGATGQLGRLVIKELLQRVNASDIIAAVRTPEKAEDLSMQGIKVREADYTKPETLVSAFSGGSRLLLISGNNLGQRIQEHQAAIDAAVSVGVGYLAYTSILNCEHSPLLLAQEHRATEHYIKQSGLDYALLRNGWYYENQTAAIPQALSSGTFIGASEAGRFAAALRQEYAEAAAIVLAGGAHHGSVLELAGDFAYSRAELAAEVSRQTGKSVGYTNLSEADYRTRLASFLPETLARVVADAEAHAANGALDDSSRTLGRLLGRATISLKEAVATARSTGSSAH